MHEATRQLALLVAFRALPFVTYVCASDRFRFRHRALVLAMYLPLCIATTLLRGDRMLLLCFAGMAYYLVCACAVPHCAALLQRRRVSHAMLFAGFVIAYLVVPSLALPTGLAFVAFLVVGWELLLSSYSYCHDTARAGEHRRSSDGASSNLLSECLFFLFVDPTLAFGSRGRLSPGAGLQLRWVARGLAGVAAMWLAMAVLRPAYAWALQSKSLGAATALTSFGVLRFLCEYALHSGLASLQISLMRHVGYVVPERYHLPWLARDPLDFWRRWNVYVGTWLRCYVFVPLSRRLCRLSAARVPCVHALLQVVVLLLTVIASGLLHDGFTMLATGRVVTRALGLFMAAGVGMSVWLLAARLMKRRSQSPQLSMVIGAVSRVALLVGITLIAIVWG